MGVVILRGRTHDSKAPIEQAFEAEVRDEGAISDGGNLPDGEWGLHKIVTHGLSNDARRSLQAIIKWAHDEKELFSYESYDLFFKGEGFARPPRIIFGDTAEGDSLAFDVRARRADR